MQCPRSDCVVQLILALAICICSSPGVQAQSQRNLGVSVAPVTSSDSPGDR